MLKRCVIRKDFDGLVCAVILTKLEIVDSYAFATPYEVQHDIFKVGKDDVICNLPFQAGCHFWFDHHSSESLRLKDNNGVKGLNEVAKSCAHVVWHYFQGHTTIPSLYSLVQLADKMDSGDLTQGDILHPGKDVLFGFLVDPRTGLYSEGSFKLDGERFVLKLISLLQTQSVEEVLRDEDVLERISVYRDNCTKFNKMIQDNTKILNNIIITDLRCADTVYIGHRFVPYAMYKDQNVGVWITAKGDDVFIALGRSIIKRTFNKNLGEICLKFGGGGHPSAATCVVKRELYDEAIKEIIEDLLEK